LSCFKIARIDIFTLQKETAEKLPSGENNYKTSLIIVMQTLELCLFRAVSFLSRILYWCIHVWFTKNCVICNKAHWI